MLKINTEKELSDFLKILSEEAVKKSRRILLEEDDPYTKEYATQRKKAKSMFEQEGDAVYSINWFFNSLLGQVIK